MKVLSRVVSPLLLLPLCLLPFSARAQETAESRKVSLLEALQGGRVTVDLRYRYEFVDQEGFGSDAHASTLRTALGYRTAPFRGFQLTLQAENVADIGAGNSHNDAGRGGRGNGVTDRPVVADPSGTDFLLAYVSWSGSDTQVDIGRQEIVLDDARFVGNVVWRQHHQTYRAIRARNASVGNLRAQYAFVDRVYRIFGDRQDTATHLINASYEFSPEARLTGYGYVLRYDDAPFQGLDTDTFGAELQGRIGIGDDVALRYEAEYARQGDAGNNPGAISAGYLHAMLAVEPGKFGFRVGWERLGGSRDEGQFSTPLATLHAFNGWADKFLTTPVDGLEDLYLRANGPLGPIAWMLVYHDFRAATGDTRYGDEFDFQLAWTAPWKQGFVLRGAVYGADEFATDTTKFWALTTYSF